MHEPNNISHIKLAAFDMDGTLLDGRLIEAVSKKFGLYDQIKSIQLDSSLLGYIKTVKIAQILKGLEEEDLIIALNSLPLMNNCQNILSLLKKNGYILGIITDSYNIVAKYLANKLNMDFFAGNDLIITEGFISGEINMPRGWEKINCFCKNSVCKRYHLEFYAKKYNIKNENTIAIGDTKGDLCMLGHAGTGIAFMPKDKQVDNWKNLINVPNLLDILKFIKIDT
ncbi:MAG TPA: HAD family phosphatase [Verrucomicrobiae bacterium]|nr:HAD family phosphatase [Verrucomicrobiae bacterium]